MTKGKRNERLARKIYEDAGYSVFAPQESKFGETDMFGIFDFVAVHLEHELIRWVQVKTNGATGIESWREQAIEYVFDNSTAELITRYDGKPGPHTVSPAWRLVMPFPKPDIHHRTIIDEREEDLPPKGNALKVYLDPDLSDPRSFYTVPMPGNSGSGNVYHLDKNCRHFDKANDAVKRSERYIEWHELEPCQDCVPEVER